jgi:hypothetical protein
MKSYLKNSIISVVCAAALALGSVAAMAQTSADSAVMPQLYNQSGAVVNSGNTALPAGYYYLGGTPAQGGHQVYYYGNGTYYDPTTQTYGGSVSDPNGTAGVALNYSTSPIASTPGVPNTGAGGDGVMNWLLLSISAMTVLLGGAYIVANQRAEGGANKLAA